MRNLRKPFGFDVLIEDDAVLGVVKPSGIPTQAPAGIDSLETCIRAYLQGSESPAERPYLGIPHRLDRPASGAMVFAKTPRAARQFSRQFQRRQVRKLYWAATCGHVEPEIGSWTDHLWKVHGQPRAQVVPADQPGAQLAVLHYRRIGTHRHGDWLEIELETGRTHQVRIQAASRGLTILGDAHYGSQLPFGPQFDDERRRAIALHARLLQIVHPDTRAELRLEALLPVAWEELALVPGN